MGTKVLSIGSLLALSLGIISAGPTKGIINHREFNVPSAKDDAKPGEDEIIAEFRANQRAAVVVRGDHSPITDLEVLVYEIASSNDAGKLVARDKGTRDVVGVTWTPARTGQYRIVIRNPSKFSKENPYCSCYVTIR